MNPKLDHVGKTFGRLTVTPTYERRQVGGKYSNFWACVCTCGATTYVRRAQLKNGNTKSCGCLSREQAAARMTTHGHSVGGRESPTYISWHNMMKRCFMPNNRQYKDYGGRGITVNKRWLKFEAFLEDMGERPEGTTLDRKDNNAGYSKKNCRWATRREQSRNRTDNRMLTCAGKTQCVAAWAEELRVTESTIRCRIDRYGWTLERTLTTPKK